MINQWDSLIKGSLKRKMPAGSTILYQGEVPRSACIIKDGTVRVYGISAHGDEQIVTYHVAGEFFPSSWIFGKTPGSLFFYETVTPSEIVFVQRRDFVDYIHAKPERLSAVLDYFTTNYTASLVRISALEQAKAREKLLYTLFYLCQRYGEKAGSLIHIKLSLTHQDLAGLVGLTRETTATEMNRLKKQKILSYDNQRYSVDMAKLTELIGEEGFIGLDINL